MRSPLTPTLSPRVRGERGPARLVCQLLLGWLILASSSQAQQPPGHLDPESDKPYRLHVVVRVADNRFLTPLFQEQVLSGVRDHLRLALSALADVEVTTAHPLLAEVVAKGLETGLDSWEQLSGIKTHFVFVDFAAGTYSLEARQYDGMTGLGSSTVRRMRTNIRDQVAAAAARLVEEDFGLVGTVTAVNGNDVSVALKGGKLADSMSRWVKQGDVFAISRITKEGAKLRGTRVPWALLEVKAPPREGTCRCRLWHRYREDDLRDLPGVLGYRCLRLTTTEQPLKLRLIDNDQFAPLDGLQVHVQEPGSTKAAELTTNRDGFLITPLAYRSFVWVKVLSGDTVRAQFPVPLTGAGTVVCRLPALADADSHTAIEFRKDQWVRRIHDDLRLASERVGDLNRALGKSMDAALTAGRSGLQSLTSEIEQLTLERDQIRRQAAQQTAPLDLRDGEAGLAALENKKDDLAQFITRIEAALKKSKSPAALTLAKSLERARLLEGEAEFDQAIAVYKNVLAASPEQTKVRAHLERLEAAWMPKNAKHAAARAYLVQTWPILDVLDLQKNFAAARAALGVCRDAGDRLTPLKVTRATAVHAAHLKSQLDALSRRDSADNLAQRKAIAKTIDGLRSLHAEAGSLAGKK
jgi:hypothetical protein